MDIAHWLSELGLAQYAQTFADNHIDAAMLPVLTDADLKELGVASLGHRKRILMAIAADSSAPAVDSARVISATPAPAAPAAPADERRQVTILFADLCGFTALSRTIDAEALRELIGRFMALVDGIVLAYGGTIDKHIGDAVMALFGAPRAHETDPLRAARAALDIHAALADLDTAGAPPLRAHIGIASGAVLAGALGRGGAQDYTVHGDSVNLAARLVDAAAAGETLLSDTVRQALAGSAVCEAAGDMRFKGIDTPTRVWRLVGATRDPACPKHGRFVGRQAELEQFRAIARAALATRDGHIVHVRGPAGIGKTRLVEEMRAFAHTLGFTAHRALVLDFGVGRAQDPLRAIIDSLVGLHASASRDETQAVADRLVHAQAVMPDARMFLHALLDLPQTGEWRSLYEAMDHTTRTRGKAAVVAALTADACRHAPAMIVVEDLHWADAPLLGYLAAFAAGIAGGAGLLVTTARIDGDPLDAALRARLHGRPLATIDLGPLRREEALSLASRFVDASQRVALACIERAAGNPLFLEQLLRNVEEGSGEMIPPSIQSLVLARMDRLAPRDRAAFRAASVIGQRFDLALLRHLLDDPVYDCDALIDSALIVPEGDNFLFAHALLQESAYSTLLRAPCHALHRRAAEWFAADDPVLFAQHLDRADDERAPRALLDAAIAQRAGHHTEAALRLVARGLDIARTPRERHALTCFQGELQRDLGDIAASIATYRAAVSAAPDDACLCDAQLGLAEGLRVSEGLDEALALLDAAQGSALRDDRVNELAQLHHLRGNILFPLGRIDECQREHERGLAYAKRLGSPEAQARALGGLADAAYAQGRMRTAFGHFSASVALAREHGFGRIEVANRSMIGFSRMFLNELREARDDAADGAREAGLASQARAQLLCETLGVFTCYELGDDIAMQRHVDRETQLIRQLGARRFEAQNMEMQGRMALCRGDRSEARRVLRASLALCREVGMQFSAPKTLGALSLAVDAASERARLLDEGAALLRRGAVGHNHLWFHRDAIDAMLLSGDAAGALRHVEALEAYTRDEPLPWSQVFAMRGRALAAALDARSIESIAEELARVRDLLMQAGFSRYVHAVDAALARL